MIAHPPFLFLGYAGFTIPFAILFGALIAGRRDNDWVIRLRRWTLASWLFLSIGIILGAQWAYYELGWGGYWAWDPVENASLLPWLTATALMHSIMVQQHRGMLKMWNAVLVSITFLLCIFGTWLTRSGAVASVHAFGGGIISTLFLGFIAVATAVTIGLILWRRPLLRSERALETLLGREGMFLATNMLLMGMMLITLIGTLFPLLSGFLSMGAASAEAAQQAITVKPAFYNKVVAPLGMILVMLMAMGPLLVYGRDAGARLVRRMIIPAIIAVVLVVACVLQGLREPWALACVAIASVAGVNILVDFARSLASRRGLGENLFIAALRLLDTHHRRYGAQIVHAGVIMMVVGIVASSLFSQDHMLRLTPGQSVEVAGRTLRFDSLQEVRRANYTAVAAGVELTDADGVVRSFSPERRFYDKSEQPNSEVAIASTWREDVYVTLAGWDPRTQVTAIEVIINPLVSWIWIGGAVLTLGAMLALLPRFGGERVAATNAQPVSASPVGQRKRERRRGQAPAAAASVA